jgi:type IV pilus assembly protein PilC
MERFSYRALNHKGRPIKGSMNAVNEVDLYNQLQSAGLELVTCRSIKEKKGPSIGLFKPKVKIRDMIQLFIGLEQMQAAGVPMLEALSDIREGTDNQTLRDIMSDIYRNVTDGASLSEAMSNHQNIFSPIYLSLISAGESTGDLTKSYRQLIKFLKWVDEIQSKIKKATRYPMVLGVAVILTCVVMMGYVVPQITGFIKNLNQELPFITTSLVATSEFFQNYWWFVAGLPIVSFIALKVLRKSSDEFKFHTDALSLQLPVFGPIIRKINIARFAQTFGALYSSGIDVITALKSAQSTITNMAINEALEASIGQIQTGATLSSAFNSSGEFPSLVVRMVRIGEESGNLAPVFDQISEFYTKDVDEAVGGMIAMIEPALTLILGGMILWIAAGVFGPIYSSFEKMKF